MRFAPGTRFGPYEIHELVGAGGMGEVYRALDTRLGRDVAIKVLPETVASDAARQARFEREARAAAALNHPNICAVFDVGAQNGTPFIVSELLPGESLRELLTAGSLSRRQALDVAAQVARALSAAHARGVVHRDLKPENIIVSLDGRAKVLDFGLASLVADARSDAETVGADRHITEVGQVLGTIGYMSPEQIRGQAVDSRSDIFSFGIVLFEMLAGRRPFYGDTAADTVSAILREEPPELDGPPAVPPILARIIRRCLEKVPQSRFQSAEDLAFALEGSSSSTHAGRDMAAAAGSVSNRRTKQSRRILTSAVVLLVVAAGVAIALALPPVRAIDPTTFEFTPLAVSPGYEGNAVWSPDGRSIAYSRTVAGSDRIFVRAVDSDAPAIQIAEAAVNGNPMFWWPDSARLGYVWDGRVWAVSLAGGQAQLVQGLGDISSAALSPDGKTLALWRVVRSSGKRVGSVWLASPADAAPREYEPAPFQVQGDIGPNYLYFSPDGRRLLLAHALETANAEMWLLPIPPVRGDTPERMRPDALPATTLDVPKFSWMPDSRRLVMSFATPAAPQGGLWMVHAGGGRSALLSATLTGQHSPSVSPDGRRIAFTSGSSDFNIFAIDTATGSVRETLASNRSEHSPSWLPDGNRFVYACQRGDGDEIRIYTPAEERDELVLPASSRNGQKHAVGSPAASPDGKRVAYYLLNPGGGVFIWISPIAGGAPVRLTTGSGPEVGPEWSPNGESIAFWKLVGGLIKLTVARVGRPEAGVDIAAPGLEIGTDSPPAWSPDGRWIAYVTPTGVRMIAPDGSGARTLTSTASRALAWSPDGAQLYTTRRAADGNTVLLSITVATGVVRTIAELGRQFEVAAPTLPGVRISLSPDGKRLLAATARNDTDVWILESFLSKHSVWDRLLRRQ